MRRAVDISLAVLAGAVVGAHTGETLTRLCALGFGGFLTEGGYLAPHHLAMAKGEALGHAHYRPTLPTLRSTTCVTG